MSELPEALAAHLARTATTLCQCWILTRRDGTVLGFTDHDRALAVAGVTCRPQTGFTPSELTDRLGLAIDTVDVEGALSDAAIAEADIAAGLYDGANVATYLADWNDPGGAALLRRAEIGRITRRDGAFAAELLGPTHRLERVHGRRVTRACDAELGDARCGFSLAAPAFSGSGTATSVSADLVTAGGLDGFSDGWFAGGIATWTSGVREGSSDRVVAHRKAGATVTLALDMPAGVPPQAGDAFAIVAGCDKSFATCKAKFANALNFRGFPHLPGNDAAYGYVADGMVFDGGPLVP